jgi:tetratricopeptide (TPR) repeat protein
MKTTAVWNGRRGTAGLPKLLGTFGLAFAVLITITACSAASAYVGVARGNAAFDRGSYQQATVDYLKASSRGVHDEWIAYDLANVYHALGEPDGALQEWGKAESTSDETLAANTAFNEGVLAYELGRFKEAYEDFREVLVLSPGDVDAKMNLEICYQKMTTREPPPGTGSSRPVGIEHKQTNADTTLNIVREKEDKYWQPPTGSKEQPSGSDW